MLCSHGMQKICESCSAPCQHEQCRTLNPQNIPKVNATRAATALGARPGGRPSTRTGTPASKHEASCAGAGVRSHVALGGLRLEVLLRSCLEDKAPKQRRLDFRAAATTASCGILAENTGAGSGHSDIGFRTIKARAQTPKLATTPG